VVNRPEYQHGWGSRTAYSQLRLDPLSPETAGTLLRGLLGDDGTLEPLARLLIARTEGNPFFLEEGVRTLVETKAPVGERGTYRVVAPLHDLQVPATVEAILAARIDRLPAEDKRLLQVGAVIGKDVPFALLQAVADLPEDALERGMARLQSATIEKGVHVAEAASNGVSKPRPCGSWATSTRAMSRRMWRRPTRRTARRSRWPTT
jgi:predicted ATPase